ncbi:MAG: cobaltochelatase subunit CobN, partial [Candidatus Methanodesulfokora sp.]
MKLSFIIGYGASMLPLLSKILEEESKEHGFEYVVVSDSSSESCSDDLMGSDAVVLYAYELPEKVEEALKKSKARIIISLSDSYLHLSRGPIDLYAEAARYFKTGGERNLRNLVHMLLKQLGLDTFVEPVEDVPWHGIYHPKLGIFRSLDDYLQVYEVKKPAVGILFYRSYWLYGNIKYVDDLVDAFEEEGFSVVPVFTYGHRDATLDTPTKEDSIRAFLMRNGGPIIDIVINVTSFFLLDHGEWNKKDRFNVVSGVELLRALNVPVISLVLSHYKSVDEWISDPQGLDYLSQVYNIAMPEVDGLIEPVFIAGARMDENGVKVYETYRPHAKYVARRVRKWIELRQKPPGERRIAIVLINPPCKGLEANVAVGMGLDVPESIARLLHRLKELGYDVGDPSKLPRDGKELIKMIMERKAISEFRWTSVEEIVRNGGAAAFVDEKTYLDWFNELPEDVRAKMVKDWGNPSDVLNGRVSKLFVGMVYNHMFVVPGVRFGNVFITPQPKFGCAGSACDGKVCRILHDPTITPPHQWLAVYRWITRVFKADLIMHFGTHGYLEFRPGKGVGLSPSCWPQISIDDVPHLYVYIVSNPMEGVIAKRRSYAEIIDHMYPPMAMAEVLDDLELLLNQYSKAKQSGDFTRAEITYREIVEKAKKNNIPIKGSSPEEVAEEVHRYLDMVRGTQINMGLHIFGHPPADPSKLANYAVTVMMYDSHNFPSIIRTIAEYIGLNYDEMRANPDRLNELGLTNSETINLIRKAAVRIMESILRNPELKENILDVVERELELTFGGGVY